MDPTFVLKMMEMAYAGYLRDLIKEKVDDPNSEWDDVLMQKLDCIFGYQG